MTAFQVVYLGGEDGYVAVAESLAGVAEVRHVAAEPEAVARALGTADAVVDASMKVRITDDMVRGAPALQIISTATTGADHIARAALEERGARLCTLREDPELLRDLTPAAELSWALVLACARRLVPATAHTSAGLWEREAFPGIMLNGRVLGLIGCGRIGQWMARYAEAFGMSVIGFDPHVAPWPDSIERRDTPLSVAEQADVISIHVHLTPETESLLGAGFFERVRPGAIFVNTSRGGVIEEAALLAALEAGRIGAAGLDVLHGEPDIDDHPLIAYARRHDNLLITPHCGGFSPDAVRKVCRRAAQKVREQLQPAP